jgi:hypothetical protein
MTGEADAGAGSRPPDLASTAGALARPPSPRWRKRSNADF